MPPKSDKPSLTPPAQPAGAFMPPTSAADRGVGQAIDASKAPVIPAKATEEKPVGRYEPPALEVAPGGNTLQPIKPKDPDLDPANLSPEVRARLKELGHKIPGEDPGAAPAPAAAPGDAPKVSAVLDDEAMAAARKKAGELASVRLTSHFAYWLEEGEHAGSGRLLRAWSPNQVVTDPADIAELLARKAPVEAVKAEPKA